MHGFTPNEEAYFRILEAMEPDEALRRAIAATKEELRASHRGDNIVRGESRTLGFRIEPDKD
jgi:hypothetical protein